MNLFSPFAILLKILLRPSQWRASITRVDPDLPPEFSLIELTSAHWRNTHLQRLLLQGYLLLPLILYGALLLGHLLLGRAIDGVLAAFAFSAILGLAFGAIMSAAVGIVVLALVGASSALMWPDQQVLMFDMIVGVRYALLYGLSSALILIVIANCTQHSVQEPLLRQIGGVVLGLIASTALMAVTTFVVLSIISARQTNALPGNSVGIVLAFLPTVLLGLAVYLQSLSWWKSLLFALLTAVLFMLGFGRVGSEYGLEFGGNELLIGMNAVGLSMFFVLTIFPFALTRRFVGTWPASVAAAFGGLAIYVAYESIFSIFAFWDNLLLAIGFVTGGLLFGWLWSSTAYLWEAGWNTLLFRLDSRADGPVRWLPYHAAFWDELQQFPFFELADYLVLAVERGVVARPFRAGKLLRPTRPTQNGRYTIEQEARERNEYAPTLLAKEPADALIDRVNQSQQQWAAQAAQAELDARRFEGLDNVGALASTSEDAAVGLLSTPAGLMLRNFAQLGSDVAAALAQPSPYNQRLVLNSVARDLENLQSELSRDRSNRLAARYQSVASHWHSVVCTHIDALDEAAHANQEIPNPYVVGVPLTRRQEIFVGRTDVARYVEDILRMGDHPPVLLYGPRRMGKTSLLYQLHWMLPRRILPLVVDLQGPVSLASSHVGFLHALARGIRMAAAKSELALPELAREQLAEEPFTVFDDWLDQVGALLLADDREVMLLALDEFEALDAALTAGALEEHAILGMLRHIVQHRRGVKLLLSGSHTLDEFRRWSSYLINAQVVELGYLEAGEARRLVETPIDDFPLRYEENAIAYVLHLTRGHPYLVQLLCMEIVALKNGHDYEQRTVAGIADVEAAVPAMLVRGQQFFADIELNQVDDDGRAILWWLAGQGAGYCATPGQFVDELVGVVLSEASSAVLDQEPSVVSGQGIEATLRSLVQRRLLEESGDGFRFQVEAIRRWFVKE